MPEPRQDELGKGQSYFFAEPRNYKEAAKCFRRVTQEAPQWAEGYHWLGLALQKLGQMDAAASAFKRAVALAPNDSRPVISIGVLLLKNGKPKVAVTWLKRGVAMRPHYTEVDARLFLAEALDAAGRLRDAIKEWKAVARMEPGYPSEDEPMRVARQKLRAHGIETE